MKEPEYCLITTKGGKETIIGWERKKTKTGGERWVFSTSPDAIKACEGKKKKYIPSPKGRVINKIGNRKKKKALKFKNKTLHGERAYAPAKIMRKLF